MATTTHSTRSIETATVFGRLRHTRGVAVYVLLAIAGIALTVVATREAYLLAGAADPGVSVGTTLRVIDTDERWSSLAPGDRVLAVDGVALTTGADWMRALRDLSGPSVTLTVASDAGDARRLTAETTELAAPYRLALWVRVLTGAGLFALALVGFLLRPGTHATWALLGMTWITGAWMLGETVPALLLPSLIVLPPLAGSAAMHFFSVFPRPLPWIAKHPRRTAWLYAPAGMLIAAQLGSRALHGAWLGPGTWYAPLHTARYAWVGLGIVIGLAFIARQYRLARGEDDPAAAARVRGLLVGVALGVAVPIAWMLARHLFGIGESRWAAYYNSVPILFFVGTSTYIAVRHNALAIDRFTAALAGYAVTVAVIAVAFAGTLLGLPLLFERGTRASSVALVAVTAAVFLAANPLYRLLKHRIDRRFFRDPDSGRRVAQALTALVAAVQRDDAAGEDALRAALGVLRDLQADRAELWRLAPDGRVLRRTQAVGRAPADRPPVEEVELSGPLGRALGQGLSGGVDAFAPHPLPDDAQDELWSLSLAMAAPIMARRGLAGFVAVERKRAGTRFTSEDLALLEIVAAQLGLVQGRVRDDRIGRYQLDRRLGVGGMAEVFLARQLGPGGFERKVALKRPLPELAHEPVAIEMFLDEARVCAQLRHPNIAQVYEIGQTDDTYFIAMEYVDGYTTRALVRGLAKAGLRLPPAHAIAIACQVLEALAHAHQLTGDDGETLELVHRDVTPGNVILGRDGTARLVDFGIARAASQVHVTKAGTVRGTLAYMAPEQAQGKPVDRRSDLYAAGALIYELMTGERAFPRGPILHPWKPPVERRAPTPAPADEGDRTVTATAPTLPNESPPPPPIASIAPGVPPAIDDVFYRAVSFDPARRYPSAEAMRDALLDAADELHPSSPRELARWLAEVDDRRDAT